MLALLTLFAAELNSTSSLGPVLAIGVAVGMVAMLTLLPALLVICPRGVFWPYKPTYGSPEPTTRGLWARVGWSIASRARLTWIVTAVILGVLALGLTGLKANGLTTAQGFRGHPDSVTGASVLAKHFPAGSGEPVIVIGNPNSAAQLRSAFAETRGIANVTPPAVRAGHAYLEGTLTTPPDSQAAYDTIDRVRSAVHAVPGADAQVGGTTAINLDVERASAHDRNVIIPLILVVVFVILGLLLRALVGPLILTATVVLSFAAAMGVSAFFFNHVFGFGGADTAFPLFVFVFLVALGIDYNIFLMTRVREEAIKRDARHGAIVGMAATGGVITSAGFVLAGTFAVLATIPATFLTELGFAVAFGILLDTIVVRSAAGHRAEPGRRPVDVVAEQAGAKARPGPRGAQPGARRRHGGKLTRTRSGLRGLPGIVEPRPFGKNDPNGRVVRIPDSPGFHPGKGAPGRRVTVRIGMADDA